MKLPERTEDASLVVVSVHVHRGAGEETHNYWCRLTRVPVVGEYVALPGAPGLYETRLVVHVGRQGDSDAEIYVVGRTETEVIGAFVRGA